MLVEQRVIISKASNNMDKQSNSWNGNPATNQGESSNMYPKFKSATQMAQVENLAGNESGTSTTAGLGTTSGMSTDSVDYAIKDVNQTNATMQPYLNITASTENLSAKWKNGAEDVPEAGRNQYQ